MTKPQTQTQTPADNGVNVAALLGAREALTATPEGAQFKWRATSEWLRGTHSRATVDKFFGLGAEQKHRQAYAYESDHPEIFASPDNGATPVEFVLVGLAGCLTAGIAAVAQNRNIQLKSVKATLEAGMDLQGILGIDEQRAQRLRRHQGALRDRRRRHARADRRAGGAIAKALGGVRHRDQSDRRDGHHAKGVMAEHAQGPTAGLRSQPARTDVVVIGAGHNGLAMSHELGQRGIEHVVLERAEVANAWRHERWDSLRLLTPNWMCRLPGHSYQGDDPDGFMSAAEVADFVCDYARRLSAPLFTHTPVTRVAPCEGGYRVSTPRGDWSCRAVVMASGAFNLPVLPRIAEAVPPAWSSSPRTTTGVLSSCPKAACWWSAPRPPACSWRRRSSAAVDR